MSAVTDQRLVADKLYHRIMLADGRPCAGVAGGGHERPFSPAEFEAIRRRLVACWNACEGTATQLLEHMNSASPTEGAIGAVAMLVGRANKQVTSMQAERDHFQQLAKDNGSTIIRTATELGAVRAERDALVELLDAAEIPPGPLAWRVREYRVAGERETTSTRLNALDADHQRVISERDDWRNYALKTAAAHVRSMRALRILRHAAEAIEKRGHFKNSRCADKETNVDLTNMRRAMKDTRLPLPPAATRKGIPFEPPFDVIRAATVIGDYVNQNNITNWRIGQCCSEDYVGGANQ